MDGDRFDGITRTLAAGTTRREVLRRLGGSVLGGTLAVTGLRRSGAAPAGKVGVCHWEGNGSSHYIEINQNAVKAHAAHGDLIGVDIQIDVDNCGACGNVCGGDACNSPVCVGGECSTTAVNCTDDGNPCTDNYCDAALGGCQTVNNTAACTTEDGDAGTCSGGVCEAIQTCVGITPGSAECETNADCEAGQDCINGGCFTACPDLTDPCSAGDACTDCRCRFSTESDTTYCADYNFGIGGCLSTADCPSGSYCNPFISSGDGRFLCVRPCPTL